MTPRELESKLDAASGQIEQAGRLIRGLAASLPAPIFYHSGAQHTGYRFARPDARHFCLLKSARAVSGMSACVQLARGGYSQEIGVVVRTVVECTSHIEFVLLAAREDGSLEAGPQAEYVKKYFDDFRRGDDSSATRPRIKQKDVHEEVGAWLDRESRQLGAHLGGSPAAERMWRVYEVNSNYVHARYPEVMDLYGGEPGRFHLFGMSGTPKDDENCQIVEAYATTVSLSAAHVARHFGVGKAGP